VRSADISGENARVDVRSSLSTARSPGEVFAWVDDLDRYPEWNRLTHTVARLDDDTAGPAWSVELRATVGPFARSKRLRMVRAVCRPPDGERAGEAVFERHELDSRSHAPWVLRMQVVPVGARTDLHVHLHYGGRLWTGGVLERVLADEIDRGRDRLLSLLEPPTR
jgi:hypothetical protein